MTTARYSPVFLVLPDDRLVLQRRTKDAPYGPRKLGTFGGGIEDNETPLACAKRELAEETSLNPELLDIEFLMESAMPAGIDFPQDRTYFIYKAKISNAEFEVYEGDGAEAFSLDELKARDDLTGAVEFMLSELFAIEPKASFGR